MDKYYTPVIEEFHIGFEYEDRQFRPVPTSMGIAKRRIFGPVTLDTIKPFWQIEKDIEDGDIRVKYLDKEDIESFGFKYEWEDKGTWSLVRKEILITFNPSYKKGNVKISYLNRKGFIFEGQLKNKSELKRILKQLNI